MTPTDPAFVFGAGSTLAMTGWLALALAPPGVRWAPLARRYAGRVLPLLLAVVYVIMLAVHWTGAGGFATLAEVQALFAVPGLLVAGWLHYLAFDLFVGTWIADQADTLRLPHLAVLPLLALTFLFGPAGWLAFMALRSTLWRGRVAVAGA